MVVANFNYEKTLKIFWPEKLDVDFEDILVQKLTITQLFFSIKENLEYE